MMPDKVTPAPAQGFGLRLVLILVLLNAALMGWAAYSLIDSRQGYEDKALLTTQNMARMLDQNLSASVAKIDLALLGVMDELERQLRERGHLDAPQSNAFLLSHQQRLAELSSLRVTDATGQVILGEGVLGSTPASWADRDFFSSLRDDTNRGLVVTNPVLGRVNNIWIISFVRRYNHPDGSFAGVVSAAIPVTYLSTLLSALDVGPHGTALLRDANLGLITRHPAVNTPAGAIGAKGFSQQLRNGIEAGKLEFSFHSKSTSDRVERTVTYRRMSGVPFHIVVGLGSEDYLARWVVVVKRTVGLVALGLLITSAFSWLLWRAQIKKSLADAQRDRSLNQLQKIASRIPGVVYQYLLRPDGSSCFPYASEAIRDIYRVTPQEVQEDAAKVFGQLHPDDYDGVAASIARSAKDLTPWVYEYRVKFDDGTVRWLAGNAAPDRLEDGSVLWHGFIKDIGERKQAEQVLQQQNLALARSNAELEQFAYAASHDLRQPLRMVTSYVQLLERALADKLDDNTRQMMHFATDGAKRMDQMLVSLLEYSRVGRKGEPMQTLASREAVDEALHFLAPNIADVQATVRVAGDWPQVLASPDELTRLWQNLIGNAVKYHAPDRAPQIDITVTPESDGSGWRFCVADNGIGIDPAQFDRLFKVFARLHSREQYEGAGIGLAVARKIVERHGGRIWVESDGLDQGSRFCFHLPQQTLEQTT